MTPRSTLHCIRRIWESPDVDTLKWRVREEFAPEAQDNPLLMMHARECHALLSKLPKQALDDPGPVDMPPMPQATEPN